MAEHEVHPQEFLVAIDENASHVHFRTACVCGWASRLYDTEVQALTLGDLHEADGSNPDGGLLDEAAE